MNLDFSKDAGGLIPSIVQDSVTGCVLMLGYMNAEAVEVSRSSGYVTFYSRSKQRLWRKGESSGNHLEIVSMVSDCDGDTILIKAKAQGPVCHTGADTCFGEENRSNASFLDHLEVIIQERRQGPSESSYVSGLFADGLNRIAQKVGEEAVETVIAAMNDDDDAFKSEAADLLFHYLVLLNAKGVTLANVVEALRTRHAARS
jgi:phosphoribosyl-ATP pyrophosphohydrolase/phosphoribosyl-AMP cyclohydrolase